MLALLSSGCATWSPAGGLYEDRARRYSVVLPEGWFMNRSNSDLFITREGPELQYIFIQTQPLGKPLIFSRKPLHPGMSGIEMAEYFLENNALDKRMTNLKIEDLSTGLILGYQGFKMDGTYVNPDGLDYGFVYYGFMAGDLYYGISYSAPMRVYFKRHAADFDIFFSSFRIIAD